MQDLLKQKGDETYCRADPNAHSKLIENLTLELIMVRITHPIRRMMSNLKDTALVI